MSNSPNPTAASGAGPEPPAAIAAGNGFSSSAVSGPLKSSVEGREVSDHLGSIAWWTRTYIQFDDGLPRFLAGSATF